MDRSNQSKDVVLLFDNYNIESQNLHNSFKLAGKHYPAIVIEDNGFLPDDVISVYGYFLGGFKDIKNYLGRPRYFNEVKVPDYWEISGTNTNGKIQDLYRECARIFYAEPLHKRLVRVVDWLDKKGIVRYSDHYNRYGALYARTIFNAQGKRMTKSYFSADEKEVIVENYITGDIILNEQNGVKIFKTKTEFVKYFLYKMDFVHSRIFYNSLSIPFFVSCALQSDEKKDILFWQEPVGDQIPGNMQIILNGQASRTEKIYVQKKQAYNKLIELGANPEIVNPKGYIYSFEKDNCYSKELLICTNSDQLEHCKELIEALPQVHFHIAAITEMSSKLMNMANYENVTLYPTATMDVFEKLFDTCDCYLDINYGVEILSAVQRAFLHNHLIFAFSETIHNANFVAPEHRYSANQVEKMISDIKSIIGNKEKVNDGIKKQQVYAMTEKVDAYKI